MWDENGVIWVPYNSMEQPSFHPGWGGSRRHVLDRISRPVHDRLVFGRSGQGHWNQAVRRGGPGGPTTCSEKKRVPPLRQVYRPKKVEEVHKMDIDPERTTERYIIQVGIMDVPLKDGGKRSIVLDDPVKKIVVEECAANDHEASFSKSHQFLPKWCPVGLTRTQRRKLQRLRFREKQEKELEKQRDDFFNQVKPMVPQKKEWRPKGNAQPQTVRSVMPGSQTASLPELTEQAVRPAAPGSQTASPAEVTEQAVRPPV